mgnify:FL=1
MANDNDVKIFDDTVNLSDFVPFDTETATAMMQQVAQEKQNGNLGKARRMGARLAEDIAAIDHATPPANGAAENAALMTQRRILLAFAAEVGLDAFLPNNLTAQEAQNIFYNNLHLTAPAFYDDLQESGAFSFYYLCVRDGRHVERKIGETFARLCGMADSESYIRMGIDAYNRFMTQVKRMADSMNFVRAEA